MTTYPEECPKCKASMISSKIPEHLCEEYGCAHYSRVIAVVDRNKDRAVKWRCPDCSHEWDRRPT